MIEGVRSPSLDYEFVTKSFGIATKFDTQLAPRASRIKRICVFNRTSGCPHTIALLTKLAFFFGALLWSTTLSLSVKHN